MTRRRPSQPPANFWEGNPACWRWKVPTETEVSLLQEKLIREARRDWPGREPRSRTEESLRRILMAEMHKDRCAVCGCRSGRLRTDHDHETGLIRGFLCPSCNTNEARSPDSDGIFGKYRAIHPALMCGVREEYSSGWGPVTIILPPPSPDRLP